MRKVTIYTDSACSGNPGPGGWGAVLIYGENELQISGSDASTTNNRMEMTAAIEALSRLKEPCEVTLYSDSSYLINAFNNHWLESWISRGWVKSDKKPVLNIELWKKLLELCDMHEITWRKVKGHASDKYNNICDKLATDAAKQIKNL